MMMLGSKANSDVCLHTNCIAMEQSMASVLEKISIDRKEEF